jgi:hypothetical protein
MYSPCNVYLCSLSISSAHVLSITPGTAGLSADGSITLRSGSLSLAPLSTSSQPSNSTTWASSLFVVSCVCPSGGGGAHASSGMVVGGWYQMAGEFPHSNTLSSYGNVASSVGSFGTSYACGAGSESEMEGVGTHLASS